VLRGIVGHDEVEVTGGWRKLHYEEHHNLYSSQIIIRMIKSKRMRLVEHGACVGEVRNASKILVVKHERNRLLGRPRHRWEDTIKMDLKEIGCEGVDLINLAQDRD
jgi:hypothetical protein